MALLSGCNIRPLYGGAEGEAIASELAAIDVQYQPFALGQYVGNQVEQSLNPAGLSVASQYQLILEVEEYISDLAVQTQGVSTRRDLYLLVSFTLRRIGETTPMFVSATRRVASYDVVRQPYAELTARWDAERRAAVEIGQEIRTRLALFFERQTA